MSQAELRFPVGAERQPVYDFLKNRGFVMSKWSDKYWTRWDQQLVLYGAGSRAQIIQNGFVIADDALETAVEKAST